MNIGPYKLPNNVFVAPMAGVTDRPYRRLCKSLGAGYAVSEMAASNPQLWASEKTSRRLNHDGENAPVAVQLAGADPRMLAEAARSQPIGLGDPHDLRDPGEFTHYRHVVTGDVADHAEDRPRLAAGYRYQHGLSSQEGVQRCLRFGIAQRRRNGGAHS